MAVTGIVRFERLFRIAAELDVDKQDIKRVAEFIARKLHDLLLRAEASASANGRDIIEPYDVPIPKGLQEDIHAFRRIDEDVEIQPILDQLALRPPLDRALSVETDARLPELAGGLVFALARLFKILDPQLKNPQSEHWDKAEQIFDLLL
ncbi:MAG: hypothetical protein JWM77_3911 [Rhodospirillales bacterium]|jgi:hypothetical protein|nr:hypothetical protein [Rhodospirillales bacterium]